MVAENRQLTPDDYYHSGHADKEPKPSGKDQKTDQFYSHLTRYLIVITMLFVINMVTNSGYIWAIWPAMGWGIALLLQAADTFEFDRAVIRLFRNHSDN